MFEDLNDASSSSKQIRVRSRDRGRHRDRDRGRDPEHHHRSSRSSTLPDLGTAGIAAADDDGNGDKAWYKKKTVWASVATVVSHVFNLFMGDSVRGLDKTWETKTFSSHHGTSNISFKQSGSRLTECQASVLALLPAGVSANASKEAASASMKAARAAGKSAEASTRAADATEKSSRAVVGTALANKHIDNRGNYCGPTDHFKGRSGGSQRGSRSR